LKWKLALATIAASLVAILFVSGQNSGGSATNPYEGQIQVASWPYSPTPQTQANIRVKSTLIDIGVVVRDAQGNPVGGLQKEDFQVFDNGKPREITNFSVMLGSRGEKDAAQAASSSPVAADDNSSAKKASARQYVGFFFDDANMEPPDLIAARRAALKYLKNPLGAGEFVGIFTTSGYVTTDFTNDASTLEASLNRVLPRPLRPERGPMSCPRIGAYQAYQIVAEGISLNSSPAFQVAFEQAVQCNCQVLDPAGMCRQSQARDVQNLAQRILDRSTDVALNTLRSLYGVVRYMGKFPGRRSLLLASDGFFTQNIQLERDRVIDTAAQSRITINSLDASGLAVVAQTGPAILPGTGSSIRMDLTALGTSLAEDEISYRQDVLSAFSEGTGGTFFHNNNDLNRGVNELASEPDVAYSLAISGDNLKADGTFHSLKISVPKLSKAKVAARRGFFAPSNTPAPDPIAIMRKMVLGTEELHGAPVTFDVEELKPAEKVSGLKIGIKVDLKKLSYRSVLERKSQKLLFVSALLDTKGNFLTGVAGEMNMKLTPATLKKIESQGAEARISLQAPPGQYKLREIVRESTHGKFTATTRDVTIE
jgi:VWFA-related protein